MVCAKTKKNFVGYKKSSTFAADFREWNHPFLFGAWRSWLAHLHGVQGVESSSLFAPTKARRETQRFPPFVILKGFFLR